MTYVITDRCIGSNDTGCIAVCPADCIHPEPDSADFDFEDMSYINPDACIDCGLCVDVCPSEAIFVEEELPQSYARFVRINAEYFENRRP